MKLKNLKALGNRTDYPLFAAIVGKQGDGKSTCIGTIGGSVLYLYTKAECHGPVYAASGSADIFPVCIEELEQLDIDNELTFSKTAVNELNMKVGDQLPPNLSYLKLRTYLKAVESFDTVAIDSLTTIHEIFKGTDKFKTECGTTKNGELNKFQSSAAYVTMYNDLVNDCSSWGTAGKNVLMTLAGTHEEQKDDGQASGLKPTLPMFGVSHFLLHYFPDILPLKRVDGEVVFDMTTSIGRKQFTQDGAVKKECSVRGRLRNLQKTQINQPIPADLSKLPKIVKRVLENKKKKDQG